MFFQTIYPMLSAGTDLSINIRRVNNTLCVAVMPRHMGVKDESGKNLVPLILNGTPEELDAEFLKTITAPVSRALGMLTNLETFEKQTEKVSAKGKTEKTAVEKETKEAREKREKMEKLLKKADEAHTAHRHSEALTWLKQARVLAPADAASTGSTTATCTSGSTNRKRHRDSLHDTGRTNADVPPASCCRTPIYRYRTCTGASTRYTGNRECTRRIPAYAAGICTTRTIYGTAGSQDRGTCISTRSTGNRRFSWRIPAHAAGIRTTRTISRTTSRISATDAARKRSALPLPAAGTAAASGTERFHRQP